MNPAQKRTWWTFSISLLTLAIAGVIITLRLNGILDSGDRMVNQTISICSTIPLILIVILSKIYPGKTYDERDGFIESKATIWGIIGTFGFMALGGYLVLMQDVEGTVKSKYLLGFVYLAVFFWIFLSSAAAIFLYLKENTFGKQKLQGEVQ